MSNDFYKFTLSKRLTQPWASHHFEVNRSDGHPWWFSMPVLPMFLPVQILHLGIVKQVCDLKRHAQYLHPWIQSWAICMQVLHNNHLASKAHV